MKITQRNANFGDAHILLSWRNHQSVRKFSLQSELIPIDEHLKWLEDRLQRVENEPFYVFEYENEVIGMCRLDFGFKTKEQYEVSILVNPDQRSKGIGTKILEMSCTSFFTLLPIDSIIARVKKDNFVSIKLFENAGFSLQGAVDEFLHFEKYSN